MSGEQNWRIDTDAEDYFGRQKKTLEVADRRPVIRQASDIVGPGIGQNATRITDYSDPLATFNGYYSSSVGALSAPNATESFVGYVISDAVLGGRQVFTGLTSGTEYSRTFTRSPVDPESLGWSPWVGARIPATATGYSQVAVNVAPTTPVVLPPPPLTIYGQSGVYESTSGGVRLRQQGVYTGYVQVGDFTGSTVADLYLNIPNGNGLVQLGQLGQTLAKTVHIPFTAVATDAEQGVSLTVFMTTPASSLGQVWWRFSCTRVGDAV